MPLSTIKLARKQKVLSDDDEVVVLALWFLNREYRQMLYERVTFDDLFQSIATGICIALRKGGYESIKQARENDNKKFRFTNFSRFYVHHEVMEMFHLAKWWPISIPRKVASAFGYHGETVRDERMKVFTSLTTTGFFKSTITGPFAFVLRRERRKLLYKWVYSLKEPDKSMCLLRLAGKQFNEIDRILGVTGTSSRFSQLATELNPSLKRGGLIYISCLQCGKKRAVSGANRTRAKFCSRPCHDNYKTGKRRGDEVVWEEALKLGGSTES